MKKQQQSKKKNTKKNKQNIQIRSNNSRNRKPHYKKQESGIYNKKKSSGKVKKKNKAMESVVEELVANIPEVEQVVEEPVAPVPAPVEEVVQIEPEPVQEPEPEPVQEPEPEPVQEVVAEKPAKKSGSSLKFSKEKKPKQSSPESQRMLMQLALAGAFSMMGILLLFGTILFIYTPMRQSNQVLADERLQTRMELSMMISEVFPTMDVDDELSDILKRSLENKAKTLRAESTEIQNEIFAMCKTNENVIKLLGEIGYTDADFNQIASENGSTTVCVNAINSCVKVLDERINELGVAKLQEEIATYKGTVSTVTREDENGETITEVVITGGLVPELQAKKDELQKKYDDLVSKSQALDKYLKENKGNIEAMYHRLENAPEASHTYAMMEAITAYVKANPKDNIFLDDIAQKLQSFPGESKEEDDILFIMKIESETGIHMQTVNYGQDYQHKKLSNGMLLCYEVYSIPYYSNYQGLKNLIAYFNNNDDFYASIYTLSVQYNAFTQTFTGNIVILHYYLLEAGAEYVPPTIDEVITPGVDNIFGPGTGTGNKPTVGQQSKYTPEDIEVWLAMGMTLEEIRDKLKEEGYPATELAWILKRKYNTEDDIIAFLDKHSGGKDYRDREVLTGFFELPNTNDGLMVLYEIFKAELPEEDDDDSSVGKQSNYTVEKVEKMMTEDGMSIVEVRDQIKAAGYPAIELAWVLHEECKTEDELLGFMIRHGEISYLTMEESAVLFECSVLELQAVFNS